MGNGFKKIRVEVVKQRGSGVSVVADDVGVGGGAADPAAGGEAADPAAGGEARGGDGRHLAKLQWVRDGEQVRQEAALAAAVSRRWR
ncbi:hypothetical protein U1Q18_039251 [Sarracenia purpurea var. burkii]